MQTVDLKPIRIRTVQANGGTLQPVEPLIVAVRFDASDGLYLAEIDALGISAFAETMDMLQAAIEDEIAALWSWYACAPDQTLTPAARRLKARVRAAFREMPDAA